MSPRTEYPTLADTEPGVVGTFPTLHRATDRYKVTKIIGRKATVQNLRTLWRSSIPARTPFIPETEGTDMDTPSGKRWKLKHPGFRSGWYNTLVAEGVDPETDPAGKDQRPVIRLQKNHPHWNREERRHVPRNPSQDLDVRILERARELYALAEFFGMGSTDVPVPDDVETGEEWAERLVREIREAAQDPLPSLESSGAPRKEDQ